MQIEFSSTSQVGPIFEDIIDLRAKLLEAEAQHLSGVKTYTMTEVRDYIQDIHNETI